MLPKICFCAVVLLLAACGGGSSPDPVEGARPVPQRQTAAAADVATSTLRVFQAFHGRAPTAAEYAAFPSRDPMALGVAYAGSMAAMGDAHVSTAILTNMGVTASSVNAGSLDILQTALTQYFGAYGPAARGVIVNNLVGLLANLERDATWGRAALAFNISVANAHAVLGASTAPSSACTPSVAQGFAGNIESTFASAGDSGGSGGGVGGDGGGAAAGGGLGKVLGGNMVVTDLSTGNVVGQGITDSVTGLVTIRTCSLAGPFLLRLEGRAGARYFDEGANALLAFPAGTALHALVDAWDEHVGVSPLTEAAYRYALNNFKASAAEIAAGRIALRSDGSLVGLTAAQVRQANAVVLAEMNAKLTDNYAMASAKTLPTPVDAASANTALKDNRYGRSAAVNGGIVRAAQFYNPAHAQPALRLADDLARDMTDGRVDGFTLDGGAVSAANQAAYASVRLPLAGQIATNAVADQFGATTIKPALLQIEEEAVVQVTGRYDPVRPNIVSCDSFADEVALMSDRSVTISRRSPTANGDGTCTFRHDAAEITRDQKTKNFLTGVKSISLGGRAGFAVKLDGSVWGWGDNYCGRVSPRLANGYVREPQRIEGLRDITSIDTNGAGTVAADASGALYYWMSSGAVPSAPLPPGRVICDRNVVTADGSIAHEVQDADIRRAELANVIGVYAAANAFLAVTADGKVYGWGEGIGGVLANSDGTVGPQGYLNAPNVEQPAPIGGLGKVRQLALNSATVFALLADGTVWAWGNDGQRLLGAGTTRRTLRPTPVPGVSGVAQIAASFNGVRMLRQDGTVLVWEGTDSLGNWMRVPYWVPTVLPGIPRVRHIAPRYSGFSMFFANGTVGRDVNDTIDATVRFR